MTSPNRRLVLENLKTTLEGIRVASGYRTTVYRVERLASVDADVQLAARPYIGIVGGDWTYESYPSNRCKCRYNVTLACFVSGSTATTQAQNAQDLEDDIFKAIRANPSLSASGVKSCTMVNITGGVEDMSDLNEAGYLEVKLEIIYHRDYGATT